MGTRRTSESWANYGWPIVKDLQTGLAVALDERQSGIYPRPNVDGYMRGIREFSLRKLRRASAEEADEPVFSIEANGEMQHMAPHGARRSDLLENWF